MIPKGCTELMGRSREAREFYRQTFVVMVFGKWANKTNTHKFSGQLRIPVGASAARLRQALVSCKERMLK